MPSSSTPSENAPSSDILPSQIPPLRIQALHHLHALLIHREHNPTAQNQPPQPRDRPTPQRQDALIPHDLHAAIPTVPIALPRGQALHARLDRIDRLRGVHGDQARDPSQRERAQHPQLLPRLDVPLSELLQARVRAEPHRTVRRLPRRRGDEPLREAPPPLLPGDHRTPMKKPPHPRLLGLRIIDQLRLDALKRRDREQALRDAGAKARDDGARPADLALAVGQQALVEVERHEADPRLQAVADDQRRAARVPRPAEGRPREPRRGRETLVQLRARLGELEGVRDRDFDGAGAAAREDGAEGARLWFRRGVIWRGHCASGVCYLYAVGCI